MKLQHDQFRLFVNNGRRDDSYGIAVDEPFRCGDEERVRTALNRLHLRGLLLYADGSSESFLPELPARIGERVYGPAGTAPAPAPDELPPEETHENPAT